MSQSRYEAVTASDGAYLNTFAQPRSSQIQPEWADIHVDDCGNETCFAVRKPSKEGYIRITCHQFWKAIIFYLSVAVVVYLWLSPAPRYYHPSSSSTSMPKGKYELSRNWNFYTPPMRREYTFTITDVVFAPDGVARPGMLINNEFPGPLIEANEDDTLIIHVINQAENATAIHWHGIYQNGTNWMDGTVGITQCPIAPNTNFTYEFNVKDQYGTFWYHAHYGVQASDGLYGPLVIHPRGDDRLVPVRYASDRVLMVGDHYYTPSSELLIQYLAPDRENSEPVPDTALINGKNVRNCTELDPDLGYECDSSDRSLETLWLDDGQSHRLRIINVGALAEFQIQVDEHEFAIIEADQTLLQPVSFHRLNVLPAQRYSIVLTAPKNRTEDAYWLRARMVTHCFAEENPIMQEEVRAVLRWMRPSHHWKRNMPTSHTGAALTGTNSTALNPHDLPLPTSRDWPEIIELECRDMNLSELHPLIPTPVPATADDTLYLRTSFRIGDWKLSRGYFNTTTWRSPYSNPSLYRMVDGLASSNTSFTSTSPQDPDTKNDELPRNAGINTHAFSPNELVYQTSHPTTLDILVSNFDDGTHPLHLHGHTFFVLAQGQGYPPSDLSTLFLPETAHNNTTILTNPLRRDTASIPAFGWTLLRVTLDNPGLWAFHCHIAWHVEAGMVMQFAVRTEVMKDWVGEQGFEESRALCAREGIERGRGPEDKVWEGEVRGS